MNRRPFLFGMLMLLMRHEHGTQRDSSLNMPPCQTPGCMRHLELAPFDRQRGEKHGRCKLTARKVQNTRRSTESLRKLAKRYGVAVGTIRDIRDGRTWTHV